MELSTTTNFGYFGGYDRAVLGFLVIAVLMMRVMAKSKFGQIIYERIALATLVCYFEVLQA